MNNSCGKYTKFDLCLEMLETVDVIRNYNPADAEIFAQMLKPYRRIFLTGEGSSRIFPAQNLISSHLKYPSEVTFLSEGALQACEYDLSETAVVGLSNSGRTKELIQLFQLLSAKNHSGLFTITSSQTKTPLTTLSTATAVLQCGAEKAVAATKSVVEQALFLDVMLKHLTGKANENLSELSNLFEKALAINIPEDIIRMVASASRIYFAGRNNGVGEELALKTNEIARKKSDFLPGTYLVHGIEEVMDKSEIVVLVDPFEHEEQKIAKVLNDGVGMEIIAISNRKTLFPTILVPEGGVFNNYIELAAGWNLLVEVGLENGVNIDKGLRARKIGNEIGA